MKKIYLYNDYHNGDIVTNRCLIKALINYPELDIAVGSYKDRYYLVGDLPVQHIISEHNEGAMCLGSLCPPDRISLNTWCGTFADIDAKERHNWITIVETWNRHSQDNNLGVILPYKEGEVPMVDFHYVCKLKTRGRAIYVENGPIRSSHSNYNFPLTEMSKRYPEFNFYCTGNTGTPNTELPNLINCEHRNLVELSFLSNTCEAILGRGSGPFLCTYTEVNRQKPRAVFGYGQHPFWKYRDNPLRYLNGEDVEVFKFLDEVRANPPEEV